MKKNVRYVRMAKGGGRNYHERDLGGPTEAPLGSELGAVKRKQVKFPAPESTSTISPFAVARFELR